MAIFIDLFSPTLSCSSEVTTNHGHSHDANRGANLGNSKESEFKLV